jgi:hypothetical protein
MTYIFGFAAYTLVVMTTPVADARVFSRRGLAVWRRINMHAGKATRRCANAGGRSTHLNTVTRFQQLSSSRG